MATTLPTFTVSDATAARILKAFENQTDNVTGAPLTPAQAYKNWLRESLTGLVIAKEKASASSTLGAELT